MLLRSNKPRYNFVVESAYDFIIENNINELPVDPFEICTLNNWTTFSSNDFLKQMNSSNNNVLNNIKSGDGIALYCPLTKENKIIYNKNKIEGRIRWTIVHEIGHIVLEHLNDKRSTMIKGGLNKSLYTKYEQEADCFAGIVLAPPIILSKLNIENITQIKNICNLTFQAASARFDYIKNIYDYNFFKEYYPTILNQFHDFIYKKYYPNCDNKIKHEIEKAHDEVAAQETNESKIDIKSENKNVSINDNDIPF